MDSANNVFALESKREVTNSSSRWTFVL
jgi:hypothetical protein